MLIIRREQMAAFQEHRRRSLERRLTEYISGLRETRRWALAPGEVAGQVARGVESGLRFFRLESEIARYCEITIEQFGGWYSEDHPETALSILGSRCLPAARRLDHFERWASRRKVPPRAR